MTYPFDVGLARKLYLQLFQPFDADLAGVRHLIFEPDGAMLRLPPNLLIASDAGIDAYRKRAAGRRRRRVRLHRAAVARPRPRRHHVGFGARIPRRRARRPADDGAARISRPGQQCAGCGHGGGADYRDCALPLSAWAHPISAKELQIARDTLAAGDPMRAQIVTGAAFTDNAVKGRSRPRPVSRDPFRDPRDRHPAAGQVPGPAGAADQLRRQRIGRAADLPRDFRPSLDADLVILSACDTASKASTAATREAGLVTGGDVELDGLVRAFVAAGGRTVLASHWPVPDDFNATQRLITGLFAVPSGTSVCERAQAIGAKADGRSADLAPILLGGVRGDRRRFGCGGAQDPARDRGAALGAFSGLA